MNQNRRKAVNVPMEKINHVCAELENIRDDVDFLKEEENDSYYSYPENLQESEKATKCLENVETFEEIYDYLGDCIDEINAYLENLSEM